MLDYGRGGVLGAATTLPITAAASAYFVNTSNVVLLITIMVINTIALVVSAGMLVRYLANRKDLSRNG